MAIPARCIQPSYHYYLRDHLGGNRMVVSGNVAVEQANEYYAYGGPWGDVSTNQGFQSYKYNGKELDRVHGLDWYDYGARRYDPAYCQFTQMDPLCEQYPHLSPYVYCAGNPVRYVDPDGEKPKLYEAALMAAHVYGGHKAAVVQKDLEASGWKISSKGKFINMTHYSGLQSALYEKTENGQTEYAYVFAGTNSLRDWAENIAQAGGLSVQYSVAVNNALQLVKELESSELTFVGHSLGGGEAAAASMATGKAAITFNPASVSIPTRLLLMLGKSNNIENYIASGLKIPIMQTIIGGDPLYYLQSKIGMLPPGKNIYVPIGFKMPLKSHDILEMIMHIQHE